MIDDLLAATRSIVRRPRAYALLILSLSLGVGAATAIFSVVDAVLLQPPPFANVDRLARLWTYEQTSQFAHPGLSPLTAAEWNTNRDVLEATAIYSHRQMLVSGVGEPAFVQGVDASAELMPLLGVAPRLGRSLTSADVGAGAPDVALISEGMWRTRFGGRADVMGQKISIDNRQRIVVGVLPGDLRFPTNAVSVWLPLQARPAAAGRPARLEMLGRVRAGLSRADADARVATIAARGAAADAPKTSVKLIYFDAHRLDADVRRGLIILGAAVACLLLVGCTNAANLLLIRFAGRWRELAIRGALGASRAQVVRLLVFECLFASTLAAVGGVLLAIWGVDALLAMLPPELTLTSYRAVEVNQRALAFALTVAMSAGLVFGVLPALRATRGQARTSLLERAATQSRGERALRGSLVIAEIAFSTLLLVGAGLFASSFLRLTNIDPGFRTDGMLTVDLSPSAQRYATVDARNEYLSNVERVVHRVPGVRGVTMSGDLPPDAAVTFPTALQAAGGPVIPRETFDVIPLAVVDSSFFRVLRIPFVAGRSFGASDTRTSERVAIIDRDLAHLLWPGESNVAGRRFRLDADEAWLTVAGVVEPADLVGRTAKYAKYAIYRPTTQMPSWSSRRIGIETTGDPSAAAAAVRAAIRRVDPLQPIGEIAPLAHHLSETLAKPRFLLVLMATFGAVALVLALIGVYGVMSESVAQRTREIGVRMALGARAIDIKRAVLSQGLRLTIVGIVVGAGAAIALQRFVASVLYGLSPTDPRTFAAVALLLVTGAVAAVLVPSTRASRVDPAIAIRAE